MKKKFEIDRIEVEFPSCGEILRGILLLPKCDISKLPAIAMAPGLSGVKEMTILGYAELFSSNGFAVLVYDNINFGSSGGEPRQEADPQLQRRGYRDAITFLSLRPEVDADRIGIWGSSFSGGHVLEVAAHDRRVKCAVSQVPNISTLGGGIKRWTVTQVQELLELQDKDRISRFLGGEPATIKAVSEDPYELCLMPGQAAFDYFKNSTISAPSWRNELTLRTADLARICENAVFMPYISPTPLLMIIALEDELIPRELSISAFENAKEPKKLVKLDGHHFSPYFRYFEKTSTEACRWFIKYLQ